MTPTDRCPDCGGQLTREITAKEQTVLTPRDGLTRKTSGPVQINACNRCEYVREGN